MLKRNYIEVYLYGSHQNMYVNELIKMNKTVWDIRNVDGIVFFKCRPTVYLRLSRLAREYNVRLSITERHGIYFKLRNYKARYGIILGIAGFFGIIYIMSGFLWDINVIGNVNITKKQIIEQMQKSNITVGMRTDKLNLKNIEAATLLAIDELAWVSVERDGNRLNVKVTERIYEKGDEIPTGKPCSVVAAKTGQILETEVYKGKLLLEKGSGVKKGDLIVSSTVDDGSGKILQTHADAKIIALCEEKATFYQSYVNNNKKSTGKVVKKDYLVFLNKNLPLFVNPFIPENYNYKEEFTHPNIFGFKLPFRIKTSIYEEFEYVEVTNSPADTTKLLEKQLDNYKQNFFGDDEITDFEVEYFPDENGLKAEVCVYYKTDIVEKREVFLR